jgi:hypothetical protein
MVAAVHDAQHSQAVSPLRLNGGSTGVSASTGIPFHRVHAAIVESGDSRCERAARGSVSVVAITRRYS